MKNARAIGVFDSGIGGLTVVSRIREVLPGEDVVYFGDTARLPYGSKSGRSVTRFSREIVQFLLHRDVKAIVVACNSASSVALETLVSETPVPVIGVVEPGARAAAERSEKGVVGVIGTTATVRSGAYARALAAARPGLVVHQAAAPLFVHLVEEGWLDGDVPRRVARRYVQPLVEAGVDTMILGCTHYPLLAPMLSEMMGPDVSLVDSAEETARALVRRIAADGLGAGRETGGRLMLYASDVSDGFTSVGARFLGHEPPEVHVVEQSDLPWYER